MLRAAGDLFGKAGRHFLVKIQLPDPERQLVETVLRTIDFFEKEIRAAQTILAEALHQDADVRRLMILPGISLTSAAGLKAAIGDVRRFRTPANLVS